MLPISVIQSFYNPPKWLVSLLNCGNEFHMHLLSVWNCCLVLTWNSFPFNLSPLYYYKGQINRVLSLGLSLIFYLCVDPFCLSLVKSHLGRITTMTSLGQNHVLFFPRFLSYWLSTWKETLLNISLLCHFFCSCITALSILSYSEQIGFYRPYHHHSYL